MKTNKACPVYVGDDDDDDKKTNNSLIAQSPNVNSLKFVIRPKK
jgi:hypothetical protein